jgi:hypothetical protein
MSGLYENKHLEKKKNEDEESFGDLWDSIKTANIPIIRVHEGEGEDKR